MTVLDIVRGGEAVGCRFELSGAAWRDLVEALALEPHVGLVGLWGDTVQVHALLYAGAPVVASVTVEAGLYAALSPVRPGAALFERMVSDLWGHQAADAVDVRAWLDHGSWPLLRPLSERPAPNAGAPDIPEMRGVKGDMLAVGPLPPGFLAQAGHWRIGLEGGRVLEVEGRLGYGHRGVLGLMRGKSAAGAARVVARISGAATVAHSVAFARAVEGALGVAPPARGAGLRGAMLAIERVAVGLHDMLAVRAGLGRAWPAGVAMREGLLEACGAAFGHRLMMDLVRPGGGSGELTAAGVAVLDAALEAVMIGSALRWPPGVGVLPVGAAVSLGVGGAAGRASGRLDPMRPVAAIEAGGDLAARMRLRAAALDEDVGMARRALEDLPEGEAWGVLPHEGVEGLGWAEGPQGTVWHWVRLAGGVVAASFAVDPAWLHLPAFEAAAAGGDYEALPTVAGSFGLHLAGMEL